jgi:hypothetical protein
MGNRRPPCPQHLSNNGALALVPLVQLARLLDHRGRPAGQVIERTLRRHPIA